MSPDTSGERSDWRSQQWSAWSDAYDEEFQDLDPGGAVGFLLRHAGAGPVLELGAGTGRVALPIATRGVEVVAVDASPKMLERLEEKRGNLPVECVVADMAELPGDRTYPLIYCVFSSLFFLQSQDAQVSCLDRVAAALAEGGRFVLEAFNPAARGLLKAHQQLAIRSLDGEAVRLSATMNDPVAQTVTFHELRIAAEGIRILPLEARYAWPAEIDLMARLAGLRLLSRHGDWDGSVFHAGSRNHVSVYTRDTARSRE